jgi:uncharacterized protein YggU (UPF0235/DUF167 family)
VPAPDAEADGFAWRRVEQGLLLAVRLTPRSASDALDGTETLSDGRCVLKLRVRALPSDGEANAALVALVARLLGAPGTAVTMRAGATARIKTLHVAGDAAALESRLLSLLAGARAGKPRRR